MRVNVSIDNDTRERILKGGDAKLCIFTAANSHKSKVVSGFSKKFPCVALCDFFVSDYFDLLLQFVKLDDLKEIVFVISKLRNFLLQWLLRAVFTLLIEQCLKIFNFYYEILFKILNLF